MSEQDVLVGVTGVVANVVLNRPRVINALTHDMVRRISAALAAWSDDPAVAAVVISGAGERGLCAGGDLRPIYADARAGGRVSLGLWRDEYTLNAVIARYPKPVVAVMDGLVMGGGVGLSAHASHRVVTDRTVLAMPEVTIGLTPDVGASRLLSRIPRALGVHMALSTCRLAGGDAVDAGLADRYVPAARLEPLLGGLRAIRPSGPDASDASAAVAAVLDAVAEPPPPPVLDPCRDWIEECYRADSVEEVLAHLRACGVPEAAASAAQIARQSPTALKVAFEALRRARALPNLEAALNQEFRVTTRLFTGPDMVEGIRAQVVDKDRNPRWTPATLSEVTEAAVAACFAPLDEELGLDVQG